MFDLQRLFDPAEEQLDWPASLGERGDFRGGGVEVVREDAQNLAGFAAHPRFAHRIGKAKASEMMLTCRTYTGSEALAMHLANFCFADERFEQELTALAADILANSWYSNQVNKRALIEIDGLSLRNAHRLELFKNEGLAPDAAKRLSAFFARPARPAES